MPKRELKSVVLKGLTDKGVLSLERENEEAATTSAAEAPAHPDVTSGDRMSTSIIAKPDEIKLPSALPRFFSHFILKPAIHLLEHA